MNFRHLHLNGGQRCERHLTFDAKILQKLWRLHPLAREVFKRGMIVSNSFCDLQSRQQSIAREPEIAENDVARRLAAKLAAAAKHLFKNEAITNRYSGQANAFVAKHPLQAEVGHQRTDNRWRIQLPNLLQPAGHQQEDRVAVDEPAVCRHEHRPVAVSVVGDSEMRRSISHDRSQRIHVYGTAARVDVGTSGRSVCHGHIRTQRSKQSGSDLAHGPISAVDHNTKSGQPLARRKMRDKNFLITLEPPCGIRSRSLRDAFPKEIEDPRTGYPRVLADKNFASKSFADGLADRDNCWSIQRKRTSARSNAIGPI